MLVPPQCWVETLRATVTAASYQQLAAYRQSHILICLRLTLIWFFTLLLFQDSEYHSRSIKKTESASFFYHYRGNMLFVVVPEHQYLQYTHNVTHNASQKKSRMQQNIPSCIWWRLTHRYKSQMRFIFNAVSIRYSICQLLSLKPKVEGSVLSGLQL